MKTIAAVHPYFDLEKKEGGRRNNNDEHGVVEQESCERFSAILGGSQCRTTPRLGMGQTRCPDP